MNEKLEEVIEDATQEIKMDAESAVKFNWFMRAVKIQIALEIPEGTDDYKLLFDSHMKAAQIEFETINNVFKEITPLMEKYAGEKIMLKRTTENTNTETMH